MGQVAILLFKSGWFYNSSCIILFLSLFSYYYLNIGILY
jgi:ABC-type transport system involved in cytochrome bd biosynthesis fused ATPase/permease subunit